MANFFEFTQVKAPDLSTSATLLRNAGESVKDAANAFNAGAKLIRDANIEKDTRISQENTDYERNFIASFKTQEEIDQYRNYVNSDEYKQKYGDGLYVDTSLVLNALDSQPDMITTSLELDQKLRSKDMTEYMGGVIQAVNIADTEAELVAILESQANKGLTVQESERITQEVNRRRTALAQARSTELNQRVTANALADEQRNLQYNKDMLTRSTKMMNDFVLTPDMTNSDRDVEVRALATDLAKKYNVPFATALDSVNNIVQSGYTALKTQGMERYLAEVPPDMRDMYIASSANLAQVDPEAEVVKAYSPVLKEVFPTISTALQSPKADTNQVTALYDKLRENGVKSTKVLASLPTELMTADVIMKLNTASSTGELNTIVNEAIVDYQAYQEYERRIQASAKDYTLTFNKEKSRLQSENDTAVKNIAKLQKVIANKQSQGQDYSRDLAELNKWQTAFESVTTRQAELVTKPMDAYKASLNTDDGAKRLVSVFSKSLSRNDTIENKSGILSEMLEAYEIPASVLYGKTPELPANVPQPAQRMIRTLYSDIEAHRAKESKRNKNKGTTVFHNNLWQYGGQLPQ